MQIFLTVNEYKTRLINTLVKTAASLPDVEDSKDYKNSEKYHRYLQLAFHAVYGAYTTPVGLYKLCDDVFAVDKNGNKFTDETYKSINKEECEEFNQQLFYMRKRLEAYMDKIADVPAELKPYSKRQKVEKYKSEIMKVLTLPFRGNLEEIAKEAYELAKQAPKE
jgi:hypothetical protein